MVMSTKSFLMFRSPLMFLINIKLDVNRTRSRLDLFLYNLRKTTKIIMNVLALWPPNISDFQENSYPPKYLDFQLRSGKPTKQD